jgi:hypothetical protein
VAQIHGRVNETDSEVIQSENPLDAFVEKWRAIVFHPSYFFQRMPRDEGYGSAIGYYLIIGVMVAGIKLFWSSILNTDGLYELAARLANIPTESIPRSNQLIGFLFSPVVLLIALYLSAGLTHVFLWMLRGAKHGFDTTTKVVAYSYSPMMFSAVPYLGGIVGVIWMLVLTAIGLREAHETTTGKGVAAILLPYVIIILFVTFLAIVLVAFGLLTTRL